jgi:hypothetical protein
MKSIDKKGNIVYRNSDGLLHREDRPAFEHVHGTKVWYINGLRHREDGPAIEYISGNKRWYINGVLHREDGPAIEYNDGSKYWYLKGILYSEELFISEIRSIRLKQLLRSLN